MVPWKSEPSIAIEWKSIRLFMTDDTRHCSVPVVLSIYHYRTWPQSAAIIRVGAGAFQQYWSYDVIASLAKFQTTSRHLSETSAAAAAATATAPSSSISRDGWIRWINFVVHYTSPTRLVEQQLGDGIQRQHIPLSVCAVS